MPKQYIDSSVRCPYYHGENAVKIYCDGIQPRSWLEITFQDKAAKKDYKHRHCRKSFCECRLAMIQEET